MNFLRSDLFCSHSSAAEVCPYQNFKIVFHDVGVLSLNNREAPTSLPVKNKGIIALLSSDTPSFTLNREFIGKECSKAHTHTHTYAHDNMTVLKRNCCHVLFLPQI